MKITLRPAVVRDVEILEYWDRQPHVLQARNLEAPDTEWNWEAEINRHPAWRQLLIGEVDSRPVAFIQIIDPREEDTRYWGNAAAHQRAVDIWIGEKRDLGKGYGTVLMQLVLGLCFEDKTVQSVLLDPLEENTRSHRFYERLGFQFRGSRMFGEDKCFVYQLTRSRWLISSGNH
ncbi:MAG: GNAT family N-acetyltransferase [Williamsia sp.]|nr:GNAT family N-acetyltransferase [Williamsia sp.]